MIFVLSLVNVISVKFSSFNLTHRRNRQNWTDAQQETHDLVAKLRDEEGYWAVQCKFYEAEHPISKSDLDSFISASSTNDFHF